MPAVMWWWSDGRSHNSVGTVIKKIMIVVGYWYYECGIKNKKKKKRKEKNNKYTKFMTITWATSVSI